MMKFLESLGAVGAATTASAEVELDSTILAAKPHAKDLWLQQGAEPKKLAKFAFMPNSKIHNSTASLGLYY